MTTPLCNRESSDSRFWWNFNPPVDGAENCELRNRTQYRGTSASRPEIGITQHFARRLSLPFETSDEQPLGYLAHQRAGSRFGNQPPPTYRPPARKPAKKHDTSLGLETRSQPATQIAPCGDRWNPVERCSWATLGERVFAGRWHLR
jgi:hypothetical protein